jgi:hypothetical protein
MEAHIELGNPLWQYPMAVVVACLARVDDVDRHRGGSQS